MSSRGYLVDMMESVAEKIALTSHIEEKLRDTEDENEKKQLNQMLKKILDLRRRQMNRLLEEAENPNPAFWCQFKHSLGSLIRDCETYEATYNEKDLELCKESANVLAMNASLFLGMEFESCARCFADKLLVKQVEKERSAILKTNDKGEKHDNQN